MYTILHYLDSHGRDHFQEWLDALDDRKAELAIIRRVARLTAGLAGDRQSLRDGVQELRIDVGPGYMVYFAFVGKTVILLACGGSKRTQGRDIASAINMLRDWENRNDEKPPLS